MLTCNCDGHPLLGRLHKPERDPQTGQVLPLDQQDKRSLAHIEPNNWARWLRGTVAEAQALVSPAPLDMFDLSDAQATDQALQGLAQKQMPTPPLTGSLF